jgi:hypothetical protein
MASVTLRFYGRFVYGRSASTGKITVMAPVFDVVKLGHHDSLMSIRRDKLEFVAGAGMPLLTTFQPKLKVVSDAANPLEAETFVWDLAGQTVSYDMDGAVTLREDAFVLDLADLERRGGRTGKVIDPNALSANPAGLITSSIVKITAGDGVARSVVPDAEEYFFLTERDSVNGPPDTLIEDAPGTPMRRRLADVVEFTVTLPPEVKTLSFTFKGQSGRDERVTVQDGTTVSFSNICAKLPHLHRGDDLEFSQYYNLLSDRPGDLGIIPREPPAPPLGGGSDCDNKAQIAIP